MRVKYNIDTKLLFQIGDPIDHSCATYVHNTVYDYANVNAVNLSMFVKKGGLSEFISACKTLNVKGFDITMPHKTDIIEFLDECDPISRAFKCVNHVKIENDKLIGIGLDGAGMAIAIDENIETLKNKTAFIIGAGAVSGAICAELCKLGVTKILIVNRTIEKAKYIEKTLNEFFSEVQVVCGELNPKTLNEFAKEADVLVQCTSLGMINSGTSLPSLDFIDNLKPECLCADVLYPESEFLATARGKGHKTIDGQMMLYAQEIAAMKFHFDLDIDRSVFLEAEEALAVAMTMREIRTKRLSK